MVPQRCLGPWQSTLRFHPNQVSPGGAEVPLPLPSPGAEETKAAGGCLRIILRSQRVSGISALSQLIFWKFTCFI